MLIFTGLYKNNFKDNLQFNPLYLTGTSSQFIYLFTLYETSPFIPFPPLLTFFSYSSLVYRKFKQRVGEVSVQYMTFPSHWNQNYIIGKIAKVAYSACHWREGTKVLSLKHKAKLFNTHKTHSPKQRTKTERKWWVRTGGMKQHDSITPFWWPTRLVRVPVVKIPAHHFI